ncbi:tripartite tricarboxylate transporter permease [Candidatus Pacearchaeota archaeon]|nr:tripartite tricarboxylate transporter permease [Candidatus Pacearchaeota archaeon]
MLFEIFLVVFLGILAGLFTGLMPGIHINFVALLLLTSSAFLLQYFSVVALVCFIISMSISHSFFDFIPSIFLSAPNDETALSILPGHKLLMKGNGYAAVRLALIGCYLGLLLLIILVPISLISLPVIYGPAKKYMFFILILASLFLILSDRKKFLAFFIFGLSGILGLATLSLPMKQPLFPLLTGLFGTSMLFITIQQKVRLPKQKISELGIEKKETTKILGASVIASFFCSFLPGLGASQAAVLGSDMGGKISRRGFLVLLGSISTLVTALNFVAIYAISKPRSGTAIVVSKLLETFSLKYLIMFSLIMIIVGGISFVLALLIAKIFAKNIEKINYSKTSLFILLFLILMSVIFSGWLGLIVLVTATALGILCQIKGIRKMHLMGCIMLPVILYYL